MIQPICSLIFVVAWLLTTLHPAFAIYYSSKDPQAIFHEATLLFQQHQYRAAQNAFEHYLNSTQKKYHQEAAAYYLVLAALETKELHSELLLQDFIVNYPKSDRIEILRYRLANLLSEKDCFDRSILLYEKINARKLPAKERVVFQYEWANTYLKIKDWLKAEEGFAKIKDQTNFYYYPAQLRIAYACFEQKKYNDALKIVQKAGKHIRHLPETKRLILQIYHRTGAFESLIAYAKDCPILSQQDQLFIADAYFFLKQYKVAVIHYEAYLGGKTTIDRESCAKLGYALYEMQQYPKALSCFQKLMNKDDYISQIVAYYIGLIYEKEGAFPAAIVAFEKAAGKKFDPEICALAYIKRGAIYYQQGLITDAITSMTTFIEDNQESKHLSTAQMLLMQCHYKSNAYQLAIDYIEALPDKSGKLLQLYQKVLFYKGLELYNKGTVDASINYLKQSLLFPFKPYLVVQAQFWLAEALSAGKAYSKALKIYIKLIQGGELNRIYYEKVLYGLAYSYFNTGNYTDSAQTFSKYLAITEKQASAAHYDAILRLGDCCYVKKKYQEALKYYASVYQYHPAHVRYQEALIYQLLGNSLRAEEALQEVITTYKETKYYVQALYHEACILFNRGNYQPAIEKFTYLLQNIPTSDLQPEVLMKRALSYENLKKNQEAAADYITILDQHPTHMHAENALMALSNLYAGTPDKTHYLQKYGHIAQQGANNADFRIIDTTKQLFYNQEYHKVLQQLVSFNTVHPKSPFLAEAYFLIAESYYRLEQKHQAISYYKKVIGCSQTLLHKKAWFRLAILTYQSKKFEEALTYYQKLEKNQLNNKEYYQTFLGLIKSSFALKKYQITTPACLQLLNNPKEAPIEVLQQAHLYLGKIAMQRDAYKNARSHLLKASTPIHTTTAAEAQYLLACTAFKLKAYESSLDALFNLIEQFPHNTNYIDQAFFLIVDNYVMLENFTQAKATLDSIISKSKNKQHIVLAQKKRRNLVANLSGNR